MKTGIRSKLVLAFVIIITVPLLVTGGALGYILSQFEDSEEVRQMENLQQASVQVLNLVTQSLPLINDYDQFSAAVDPFLTENQLYLQVFNESTGTLLYDSQDQEVLVSDREIDSKKYENDAKLNLETFIYTVPTGGDHTIKAIIGRDPGAESLGLVEGLLFQLFMGFGAGFMTLVILIGLFTWYISRSILKPLNELNAAAEHITQGNLDYNITIRQQDELGQFCHTFDVMREKLKDSLREQTAVEKSRRELIAGISHDLRTPIASIKGYVEGLQDGVVKDKKMFDRYLAVIKDKSEQLDRQIDDLFQYSRLELGRLEVDLRPENSLELLEDQARRLELDFVNDPVSFRLEKPVPAVLIQVDSRQIARVIYNLVDNARRSVTEGGQITMRTFLEEEHLVVAIADNGSGIAEEDLSHIFELFYRGEKSRSRDYGGTGLGLAICKHIVEAHRGKIWAASTPGKGSTFYFSLPVAK